MNGESGWGTGEERSDMNSAGPAKEVLKSYRKAWRFGWPFLVAHLTVRLLVLACIAPAASLVLSLAISAKGQGAVTDQDIAWFLLSPAGLTAAFAALCLLIAGSVLDVSLMTMILRSGQKHALPVLGLGSRFIVSRFLALIGFSLSLIVRVFLIAAPFLLGAAIVAALTLTTYDINYYLTHRPPEFLAAAFLIAVIALAMIGVLLHRLSGWAIALNLVLFEKRTPRSAFADSARALSGHRSRLAVTLAIWAVSRMILGIAVATVVGLLLNFLPANFGANLRGAATVILVLLALWALANAVVEAISNGALADYLHRLYLEVVPDASAADAMGVGAEERLAGAAIPAAALIAAALVAVAFGLVAGGRLLEGVGSVRTEIIAHRGAAGSRPENTMSAISKAVEDGADWVEIDVQESADDEVIIAHDSDFMKLAGVSLKTWDATMPDLAEIDIGSWFDPSYADERTPTLREALRAVRDRTGLMIELKYYGHDIELEERVAGIVEEENMAGNVAVMSLKIDGVQKMRALRPDWRYGILAAKAIGDLAALEADFLAVNTGQVSLQLIRRAHGLGKDVYAWTVDDPLTMSRMISMGIDGLITNRPALARQVMDTRNQLTTYERLALWLTDRFRIGSFRLVADESDA
jgi:glycerophosphoryl diester phosphodiesterase